MSFYLLDSSALIKGYILEIGTSWIQSIALTNPANTNFVSRITEVEAMSAVARRIREGSLNTANALGVRQLLSVDFQQIYTVIEVDSIVTTLAVDLLLRQPLRAYDAVQLATAITVNTRLISRGTSLTFVSADTRLLQAAQAEGLQTDNPENYP